jgi:hypothetical protein
VRPVTGGANDQSEPLKWAALVPRYAYVSQQDVAVVQESASGVLSMSVVSAGDQSVPSNVHCRTTPSCPPTARQNEGVAHEIAIPTTLPKGSLPGPALVPSQTA